MKIVSFNINGLRARPHQLAALIERHQPDVIGLQETKVADDQFPQAEIGRSATTSTTTGRKATTASPCSPARRPWNCTAASRATARSPSGASSGAPLATPRATRSP